MGYRQFSNVLQILKKSPGACPKKFFCEIYRKMRRTDCRNDFLACSDSLYLHFSIINCQGIFLFSFIVSRLFALAVFPVRTGTFLFPFVFSVIVFQIFFNNVVFVHTIFFQNNLRFLRSFSCQIIIRIYFRFFIFRQFSFSYLYCIYIPTIGFFSSMSSASFFFNI